MSGADDLGDYEDDAPALAEAPADSVPAGDIALEVLNDATGADPVTAAFRKGREAAMLPKPKLVEMIEAVSIASGELEDAQFRLLLTGVRAEPYAPYMRRAAALTATRNFLLLIQSKQDAVRRVLGGSS